MERKRYTKEEPLKVFTAFSGYDSQCLALKRLGIHYDLVGWSEIDKSAIQAHDALFPEYKDRNYGDISKIDWSQVPDFDFFTYSSPCVTGDTVIETLSGRMTIKEFVEKWNVGDDSSVLSVDIECHNSLQIGKVVFAGLTRKNAEILKLELSDGKTLKCTPDHKIAVFEPGSQHIVYKQAQYLTMCDLVAVKIISSEARVCSTTITSISKCENEDVYDITVEKYHNFFGNGILIHNCTDFSNAGLQAGGEEGSGTRSSLLWECRKTILAKKPKYLMFENVKALVTDKFKYLFDKWCKELESYGYVNYWQVLNAKDYGVPQSRERIFMISILKTEDDPNPYFEFPHPIPLEKTVEDIFEDNVPEKYYQKQEVVDHYMKLMSREYPKDEWNVESDGESFEGLW